jgi:arylsulfatase A-like enzyme
MDNAPNSTPRIPAFAIVAIAPALLLARVVTAGQAESSDAANSRPNVVLCMADDLGWGDVGFNGNSVVKTPHLDAMAAAGLKFTRFYAAAPVCSPTRGSCLTGRHPYRYGIFGANVGHMPPAELTLAEVLLRQGYATGHFGKWHLGTLTVTEKDANRGGPRGKAHFAPPDRHGFETFFSTESKVPTWDPLLRPRGVNRQSWWDPVDDPADAVAYGTAYWSNEGKVTDPQALSGDDSRVIMDRALPFIRQAVAADRPFLAVVWFHAPHLPVVAGPEHARRYAGLDKYRQHYYGCVTALDEQVGRLRRELRELGVAEDTMLWFCADNGPEGRAGEAPGSAGPFRGRKRELFEGGLRVPALLEWPRKVRPGRVTDTPACTSDYYPTVLAALGLDPSRVGGRLQPIDGVNIMPLIEGRPMERTAPIAFEHADRAALIETRYKLIQVRRRPGQKREGRDGGGAESGVDGGAVAEELLFDLAADPGETTDVAARHPETVRRMADALARWRASCERSRAEGDGDE